MNLLGGLTFNIASYGPAAAYAGWLLRSFGAAVRHECALDPEGAGAFFGEGAVFTPTPALVVDEGSLLVTDAPVNAANRAALEQLAAMHPVAWITPWGLGSDWDERPASGLLLQAAGGWMSAVGQPGEEPLGPPGEQAALIGGLWAAVHALGSGREPGLSVVSLVEGVIATCIYDSVGFQQTGAVRQRWGHRFNRAQCTLVTLPAADGFLGIHAALHHQWLELCRQIGRPELTTDPRFASLVERMQHLPELDEILEGWARSMPRWDAYHQLQRAGIPSAPMPTLDEVLASPQLEARGVWRAASTPSGRTYRVPGPPARVLAQPESIPDSNDDRDPGPWRPGALRVVDLSMGWAGPLVSHLLACYGADVIKLESHRRFDWWRGSRPPGDDPSLALHERSNVFNTVNRGKRGLTLDLATPDGNALAKQLLTSADVVIENFRAGAMEKLGLGYEAISRENPGLVMLRQPGFGSTGPENGYRVFGNTIEAMSGLSSMVGYGPGGRPYMLSNALGDPVSGLNGAIAVFAALEARARTGRGCCLEGAQLEGFLPLVTAEMIEMQRTGVVPGPRGNARPGHVSGLFRAAGEDAWLAVDAPDPGAVARATGGEILASWAASRTAAAAADALARAGVPAAPLHSEADILQWEVPGATGFFEAMDRAHSGFQLFPSVPVVREGGRVTPGSPAPTLGEHNEQILAGMGLDEAARQTLRERQVIGEFPA